MRRALLALAIATAAAAPVAVAPAAHAAPVIDERTIECGPGYRLHGAVCEPVRTLGESPAARDKRNAWSWIAFGALAAASLLNPFT